MKRLKKPVSLLLTAALMVCAMLGCSTTEAVDTAEAPAASQSSPQEAPASSQLQGAGTEEDSSREGAYIPGTYTAACQGMAGEFEVTVTLSQDGIQSIQAGENNETLMVGTEAIRILSQRIVENQSLNVDTVTGATYTSYALIYGVRSCVEQAGGDLDALLAAPVAVDTYNNLSREADIIIVGGGLAGMTAAITAVENGGDVILLEEKEYCGGNSVLSTGTFIFGGSSVQEGLGIEDDPDTFEAWANANSGNLKDPVQVAMVAQNGQALIDLYAKMGANFNTNQVNGTDGSEIPRGHSFVPNIGTAVGSMVEYMERIGVDVRYSTRGDSLITDADGAVVGVSATNYNGETVEFYGNHIVLASGGWGDNNDMIVEYWGEDYDGLVYGGAIGMDGTLLNAAVALGADLTHMDDQHIDATLEVTKGITITTNVLRNCGGILIRASTGQRFADEPTRHCEVAAAIMHELGDEYYYEIFNDSAFGYTEAVDSKLYSYVNMNLTTKYDSIEAMAQGLEVDADALSETLEQYNAAVRGEADDPFGREVFREELTAPFYVMKVSNGVACTTGGLKVDEEMRVLDTSGAPLPNLYAIGEISGGYRIHYVGGDSLSHSGISGMLLGRRLTAGE